MRKGTIDWNKLSSWLQQTELFVTTKWAVCHNKVSSLLQQRPLFVTTNRTVCFSKKIQQELSFSLPQITLGMTNRALAATNRVTCSDKRNYWLQKTELWATINPAVFATTNNAVCEKLAKHAFKAFVKRTNMPNLNTPTWGWTPVLPLYSILKISWKSWKITFNHEEDALKFWKNSVK